MYMIEYIYGIAYTLWKSNIALDFMAIEIYSEVSQSKRDFSKFCKRLSEGKSQKIPLKRHSTSIFPWFFHGSL